MGLEPLELLERGEVGVLVVEVDDEADRDLVVLKVIEERAAAGLVVERPAEAVLNEARAVLGRVDLPQLLDADAELRHVGIRIEIEAGDQLLGERSAHAFGDEDILAAQLHAAGEVGIGLAVAADAHVAGGDADNGAGVVVEHFGRGKAGIDLDAEPFGLLRQPAADIAERDDIVPVIVHQGRHHDVRQPHGACGAQHQEMVGGHRRLERRVGLFAPARQQPVDADGIHHRARQDVGADLGALFQHDDGQLFALFIGDLLEPDGRRQSRRSRADDDDVELHALAFAKRLRVAHASLPLVPRASV